MITPIQFGHITIADQLFAVKFGMTQSREYCKILGCELKDYNDLFKAGPDGKNKISKMETNGDEMLALVWSALKDGARVEKKEFNLSLEDTGDLIDLMNADITIWNKFFEIMQDGVPEKIEESPNGQARNMMKKSSKQTR